jgi:hypothetical protein
MMAMTKRWTWLVKTLARFVRSLSPVACTLNVTTTLGLIAICSFSLPTRADTELGVFAGRDPHFTLAQHERAIVVGVDVVRDVPFRFFVNPNIQVVHFHEPVADSGDTWGAATLDVGFKVVSLSWLRAWLGGGIGRYVEASARVSAPLAVTDIAIDKFAGIGVRRGRGTVYVQWKQLVRRLYPKSRERLDYTVVIGARVALRRKPS